MKLLNRLVVVCLVTALVAAAFPGLVNIALPANVAKAEDGGTTLYLPALSHNVTTELPPFSLQIAGLSQIKASAALAGLPAEEAAAAQEAMIAEMNAAFESMLDAIEASGAGYVRIYIDWAAIQPFQGVPYDWAFYDLRLPKLDKAGLGLIATVTNAPQWARVNGAQCGLIADPNTYYQFLEELYARYPYIDVWEILNEPDANDGYRCSGGVMNYGEHGGDYAALLEGAYKLLKGLNPAAKVIMGGMAYEDFTDQGGSNFVRNFLDDMVRAGGAAYTDGVNFHYFKNYADGWEGWTGTGQPTCLGAINVPDPGDKFYKPFGFDITAKASHVNERLKTCFGVEESLWLTEVGANGVGPDDPDYSEVSNQSSHFFGATLEDQAWYVFTIHARGFAMGAENITWYALKIMPNNTEDDYQGLLYDERNKAGKENEPKPAYYAYQTMTRELGNYRFEQWVAFDPRTNPNAEAYQFRHVAGPAAGHTKIVAWSNNGGSVPLVLNATELRVVYPPAADGTPDEIIVTDGGAGDADQTANGSITFTLQAKPAIIEIVR